MKIWLIKASEYTPLDEGQRLLRTGILFEYLAKQGHDVLWWTSTFIHGTKEYRFNKVTTKQYMDNAKLIYLHSNVSYKKNYSLSRIKYCNIIAEQFSELAEKEEKPDIILCSWPTPQFGKAAVEYGKAHGVPVITDIRDLWPDSFVSFFPSKLQWVGNLILGRMIRESNKTLSETTAITGPSDPVVEWGLKKAGRAKKPTDRCIYIGNPLVTMEAAELDEYKAFWKEKNVSEDTWNICLISILTMNNRDFETVIEAVMRLSVDYPDLRLIFAGKGDDEAQLKQLSAGCDNIVFAGWLNEKQMNSLMLLSKCGAYPMNDIMFADGFGNKPVQYISAGLPILCSQDEEPKRIIEEREIGLYYEAGNVDACMEAILQLKNDDQLYDKMSANAIGYFKNNFEAEKVNSQFEELMNEIVYNR